MIEADGDELDNLNIELYETELQIEELKIGDENEG